MDAISQAGGLSDGKADLRGLDRAGGLAGFCRSASRSCSSKGRRCRQNIYLRPYSSVYVGSSRYLYAYVIGEVQHARKVNWDGDLSIMDAVSQVGGITQNAKTDHGLVISGGVVAPKLELVDMGGFPL